MEDMQELYLKAKKIIDESQKILILSHRQPDADTLGAAVAMNIWLKKLGKDVTMACVDKPSSKFKFLPHIDEFIDSFDLKDYDVLVFVDIGSSYMTNFQLKYENLLISGLPLINIDHHISNDNYGTVNIVDPKAASTTVILYRIFEDLGVEIDEKMAISLLAGLYSDTGSFMHSNTSNEVLKIAGELMHRGAKIADISRNLFHRNKVSTLKLWGTVMQKAYVTKNKVVMSVVKEHDYNEVNAKPEQLSGVIEYLSMVPETRFAVLVNEDRKGNVRASFRTRKDGVDVAKIASIFGGGGHPKASGFSLPGKLKENVTYSIITEKKDGKLLNF